MNTITKQQRERLQKTIEHAKLASELNKKWCTKEQPVHFRPSSSGVSLVGLLSESPQLGKRVGKSMLAYPKDKFDEFYKEHCVSRELGRKTQEKILQSFLIADAYQHDRKMESLNRLPAVPGEQTELYFVTDEIALPIEKVDPKGSKEIRCDLLTYRVHNGNNIPVLIELKSSRDETELVRQLTSYGALIAEHKGLFQYLYAAILGNPQFQFDAKAEPEKWLIWPRSTSSNKHAPPSGVQVIEYQGQGPFQFFIC